LRNLDKLLTEITGIPVYLPEDPIFCVALGAGKVLDNIDMLKSGLNNTYK